MFRRAPKALSRSSFRRIISLAGRERASMVVMCDTTSDGDGDDNDDRGDDAAVANPDDERSYP